MRLFKLGSISILVLFLLITAMGLLFPSTVKVSRAININAPQDSVYALVSDINKWPLWMEVIGADSSNAIEKKSFEQFTVVHADKDSVITLWKSENGQSQQCNFLLFHDNRVNITTINWYFLQHIGWYPWERLGSMLNDKILGPFMENSLENLKNLAEHKAA